MAPSMLRLVGLLAGVRAARAGGAFLSSGTAAPGTEGRRLSPREGTWSGVAGGLGRVCRGTSPQDRGTEPQDFTVRDGVATVQDCQSLCREQAACTGVEYWEGVGRCELWTATIGFSEESEGFQCWRFVEAPAPPAPTPAPPAATPAPGVVEQPSAAIPVGGDVRLYAVGSSNAPWNTWLDQLHMTLKGLGYGTPVIDAKHADTMYHPTSVPVCDDAPTYTGLETPRIGKIGWASWGFAFEDTADCDAEGFRPILEHRVSCTNGWACNPQWTGAGQPLIRPSEIAEDARHSDVTVLSNWINDSKQRHARNVCYDGENIDPVATTEITLFNMRKVIRAIHDRNPDVVVAVMALYPDSYRSTGIIVERTLQMVADINAAMESGLRNEPNTVWVNYTFPLGEPMFQTLHTGHPNCRGDKVLAQSIVDALFRAKVLSRGLQLSGDAACLSSTTCEGLAVGCCQSAALCRWMADAGTCVAYSPGEQ